MKFVERIYSLVMWRLVTILLFIADFCFGQYHPVSFSTIDWNVRNIDAPTPDSLAKKITAPYQTELEKTRAIFSWIAQHVSYNTGIFNAGKKYPGVKFVADPYDTISEKSAVEQTAERVLRRRVAVCDGYAKLFKTLCDYAGIESEVILGYAKCYLERSDRFRTNHTWNAVRIDSTWYLLDVTWGSGFVVANEYFPHIDESYFLTPARQFVLDHYPEDLRWTLLDHAPTLKEFQYTPFKYKAYIKYSIKSMSPSSGTIDAFVGDTVHLVLKAMDAGKDYQIAPDPFFDSTEYSFEPASVFLHPTIGGNKIEYSYVVDSDNIEWIHLLYNDDPILRYKLNIRKSKSTE